MKGEIFMNKLFTKIAAAGLSLAMAVGVGVAVGSNAKEAKQVHAANSTYQKVSSLAANKEVLIVTHSSSGQYYLMDAVTAATSAGPKYITCSLSNSKITGDYDSHLFTVSASSTSWKFATDSKYLKWSGTSSNTAIRINTGDSNNTWTYSSGTLKFSSATRYLGVYTAGTDWRSYNSSTAANYSGTGANIEFYEKVEAKTLSSIAVSGATTSFTVGDTFSFGGTVTATYSDSTTADVTSSTTFSGYNMSSAGNQTVTASYTEGEVTKTATYGITVSAPTTPFIEPAKSSTSGYTGQNETLSFTYGNLTSTLGVSSSNTSVVTVGTPSASAGSGTVQINFVGAGSTTVKFKDGSTELASVSVSVTASTVTITGLAASDSVYIGKTLNLGSTITVTATGIYSSDVTWTSDDDSIATVSAAGVVTGVADGTVDITVTSDDYPSATMTCAVTVSEAPLEYEVVFGTAEGTSGITDFSNTSYIIPSGVTLDNIQGNVYSNTSNQAASLRFGKSGTTGSFDASISGNYYIVSVKCNLKYYNNDTTATFSVTPDGGSAISKTLTDAWADYTYDVSESQVKKVTLGTDINGKRAYLSGFTITYAAKKTLSNIALSGSYPTSFTKGDTFSHSGMVVTANYSDSTSAVVTGSATWSSPDMTTTGAKTITVSYSDDYGSVSTTYSITVNYAAVSSLTLGENTAEIGLGELFDYNLVSVTVAPSNANPAHTWSVLSNTVNDDYLFDASGLLAGDTEGTITLKCASDADASKYDTLVVTVTGDPTAAFVKESTTGYAGKSETISFTYGNMDDVSKITVASSNTSYVTVANDLVADEGEGLVTINFVAAGSANVTISYDGGATLDTLPVTVSADSVVSVSWNASDFNVYSGTTLTSDIDNTWLASYEMASGDGDLITYGEYTLKLGGSAITLPHTWSVADSGKTLCIEYGGVSSSTVSVTVTQSLRPVNASDTSSWDYTFDSKQWSAEGDWTLDNKLWNMSGEDDGSPYFGYDATKGQQFGSGSHPYSTVTLQSSAFSGTIESVTVYTSGASSINATVQVSVGGTAYGSAQTITNANDAYTFDLGGKSGTISIDWVNSSSKAIYVKEIIVNTVSGSHNIANAAGHEAAQRAVVKFAIAFNNALADTDHCTDPTKLAAAWSTASSAWTTFLNEAAALGSTEEEYAKNLVKYATAEWTTAEGTNSNEYCLGKAVSTYEYCVKNYSSTCNAFMSSVRPVASSVNANPLSVLTDSNNLTAIIVIVALVSITAIGGYFAIRKRKEQ